MNERRYPLTQQGFKQMSRPDHYRDRYRQHQDDIYDEDKFNGDDSGDGMVLDSFGTYWTYSR
jgi:hypothetical protein